MNEVRKNSQCARRSFLAKLNDQWLTTSVVLIVLVPAATMVVAAAFLLFF